MANLDKLLVEFEQKITARGATVLWAKDAAEANQQVLDIARKHGVKSVVKSKSMVSEELELNHVLEAAGIRAVETDLGEYIVQLAQQRPVHIVTPAIHMSAADVGRLFAEKLGEPYSEEHRSLTDIARRHLRQEYLEAGMGISGCNFAVAETGTMVVVENEGNAGLSTATPPVHVALIGIEKMLPQDRLSAGVPQSAGPQRHRPEIDHLHAPVPRRDAGQAAVRHPAGQRAEQRADGPGGLVGVALHPLRGVHEQLPRLPPRRRLGLRLGLSGPDRLDPHAAPDRSEEGGQAAVRLVAVRGVRRSVPGEDRHPASTRPSALPGRQRALAHEVVDGAADLGRFCVVHGRAAALQTGDDRRADRRAAGEVPALASRQAGRLDPRPRVAPSARPRLPKLVAAEQEPYER